VGCRPKPDRGRFPFEYAEEIDALFEAEGLTTTHLAYASGAPAWYTLIIGGTSGLLIAVRSALLVFFQRHKGKEFELIAEDETLVKAKGFSEDEVMRMLDRAMEKAKEREASKEKGLTAREIAPEPPDGCAD
jgi:hypothetical protein